MEAFSFKSEGQLLQGAFFSSAQDSRSNPTTNNKPGRSTRPVVILCHGAYEDRENWYDYANRLAEQGYSTLALDFIGHGASSGQRGLVDLRLWAYNLRDAMNALAADGPYRRFALVGWGSGGSAALLAAAHDRRLTCLAVLAAPVQVIPPLNERLVFSLASGASRVWSVIKKKPLTLSRLESYQKACFAVNEQVDAAYKANPHLQEILRAVPIPGSLDSVWVDITKAVVKITVPVLILHGTQDKILSVKQSEKLYKLLPGIKQFYQVEESGNALHLDQKKDEVYIAIARWLKHYAN